MTLSQEAFVNVNAVIEVEGLQRKPVQGHGLPRSGAGLASAGQLGRDKPGQIPPRESSSGEAAFPVVSLWVCLGVLDAGRDLAFPDTRGDRSQ